MIHSQPLPNNRKTTIDRFELERKQMVESQLRDRQIQDQRVLETVVWPRYYQEPP